MPYGHDYFRTTPTTPIHTPGDHTPLYPRT